MGEKLTDAGQAFPDSGQNYDGSFWSRKGMSKRELIAMHALAGMATSAGYQGLPWDKCAKEAVAAADALLAALSDTHNARTAEDRS